MSVCDVCQGNLNAPQATFSSNAALREHISVTHGAERITITGHTYLRDDGDFKYHCASDGCTFSDLRSSTFNNHVRRYCGKETKSTPYPTKKKRKQRQLKGRNSSTSHSEPVQSPQNSMPESSISRQTLLGLQEQNEADGDHDRGQNKEPTPFGISTQQQYSGRSLPAHINLFKPTYIAISLPDERFFSAPLLEKVNLLVYLPLKILICIPCCGAVPPNSLRKHWKGPNHDPKGPSLSDKEISDLEKEHGIFPGHFFPDPPIFDHPIPGITFFKAFVCPASDGCSLTKSKHVLTRHLISQHPHEGFATSRGEEGFVHELFLTNQKLYRIMQVPQKNDDLPEPYSENDAVGFLLQRQEERLQTLNKTSSNEAVYDPFLQKFRWHELVQEFSPEMMMNVTSHPPRADPLSILVQNMVEYYDGIIDTMKKNKHTTLLRWVKSTKDVIVNGPLKPPFRRSTTNRYINTMTRLVVFALRATDPALLDTFQINPNQFIRLKCDALRVKIHEQTNSSDIESATHELILALLSFRQTSDCIVSTFIMFFTYSPQKRLHYEKVNNILTHLKWTFRASSFHEMCRQIEEITDGDDGGKEDRVEEIVQQVRRGVTEQRFGAFTYIMELTHYLSFLMDNQPIMPRVSWKDHHHEELIFDGRLISMTSFTALYQKLYTETDLLLRQEVLLGLEIPEWDLEHIVDKLNDQTIGYSFIKDASNPFVSCHMALLRHILGPIYEDRFWFRQLADGGHIAWNRSKNGIMAWIKSCEQCIANLFALLHYGAGQPARGTELSGLKWVNTPHQSRSVFWFQGLVNIVTTYNKTQTNSERPRLICRSLPPPVGRLFIVWMTFVIPALDAIWGELDPDLDVEVRSTFSQDFFASRYGKFDTDDFSAILASLSGRPVLEGGLGYAMAVADTRHFLIAIMREHLKHLPDATRSLLEKYFDEQSGHGEDAAEHYALSFHSIGGVSYEKFSRFVELSRVHHSLLYRTSHSPSMVPGSHSANQQHMAFPFDYSILANTIVESFLKSSSFSSQLATHWAPGIHRNIAESVAALIPSLRESPSNDLTATRPSSSPKLMHAVDPSCIVDVSKICVNSRRWDELRAMMGDGAQFKSVHQACAVELCARREKDLLVVLGTGEGKSLTFMLNAFRPEERGKATVVVLPLLSLQDDLEGRMKESGIKVLCWRSSTDARTELDGSIQVVLVIADAAAQPEFLDWLLRQLSHGRIARLTFDEAHTVVTEGHYRPLLQRLKPLRQAEVQIVALTATAPIIIVPEIMELLGLLPSTTLILRAITPRKEIIYSVFSKFGEQELYTSITGNKFSPQEYVEAIANVIDSKSKIIIFCLARSTAESVAELLHGLCYHAKFTDTEKKATLWDFKKGDQRILVVTSALGLGYHLDNIDVVIHLGTPRNIIDFVQQSGRAGRNGKPSHSVIFHDPSQSTNNSTCPSIGIESMKDFVEKNRCRRITLGEADGVVDPLACHMLLPASLCDVCMQMVGIVPKWVKWISTVPQPSVQCALLMPSTQSTLLPSRESVPSFSSPSASLGPRPTSSTSPSGVNMIFFQKHGTRQITVPRTRCSQSSGVRDYNGDQAGGSQTRNLPPSTSISEDSLLKKKYSTDFHERLEGSDWDMDIDRTSIQPPSDGYDRPAPSIQISSAVARNEVNETKREKHHYAAALCRMNKFFGSSQTRCSFCLIRGHDHTHPADRCSGLASARLINSKTIDIKSFRGHLQLQKGTCFKCALPQVSTVHPNNNNNECNGNGWIRQLLFSILTCESEEITASRSRHIPNPLKYDTMGWLPQPSKVPKMSNFHTLVVEVASELDII